MSPCSRPARRTALTAQRSTTSSEAAAPRHQKLRQARPRRMTAGPTPPQHAAMTANASILRVDDDRELTAMLAEYLAREAFEIEVVHDGAAALGRLEAPGV